MNSCDVVIVGGGPAGLGAAVTLSRSRRDVLVVDAGAPRNARAAHVNSYLGREGIAPQTLLEIGRAEVRQYGGRVGNGTVVAVDRIDAVTLRVTLADESTVDARRVLVATGVVDELPDIPGLSDRWGRDVLHCAYCHAWEVRDKAVALIAGGAASLHQAQLWRQWTDRVTFFANDAVELSDTARAELAARGIAVVAGRVTGVEVTDDALSGVRVGDAVIGADAAVVFPLSAARGSLLVQLGLRTEEQLMDGQVVGATLAADVMGATNVPGVWVAGNLRGHRAQAIDAAAQGGQAGAMINIDLVYEDVREAVARHPFTPELERQVAERVLLSPVARHAEMARGFVTAERIEDAVRRNDDTGVAVGTPSGRNYLMSGHDQQLGEYEAAAVFESPSWDERYSAPEKVFSGDPNPQLVAEVTGLTPGTALDLGCGEGGDAIWLAGQGWTVTGADFSANGLARAARHAEQAGVADRIDWWQVDARAFAADGRSYDLVTSHYLHLPDGGMVEVTRRLAEAVAPGGHLLVVGHAPSEAFTHLPASHRAAMFLAADLLPALPGTFEVLVADQRPRTMTRQGATVDVHDSTLFARRTS